MTTVHATESASATGIEPMVTSVSAAAYRIPTEQPEADGTIAWDATVMVVVRVRAGRAEGLGWTYASEAAATVVATKLADVVKEADPFDVPGITESMHRACRNIGQPGVAACAISAVDVALWDLKARLLDISLTTLLGRALDCVPLYGSGGFTTYDDATTSAQLEHWVGDLGLPRTKIKIGENWGGNERRDLHRVALARKVIGDNVDLFVDANGGYTAKQAIRLGHVMSDDARVTWFEEPVSSDDLPGLRLVREQSAIDVAAGEYGYSPWYYGPMVTAQAVDCVQADATRCGGITGWLEVAHLARAHHLDISGHCAPNLHAHVALAAPNLRHLEYFHDHVRIEQMLLDGALTPVRGALHPDRSAPGHGLTFKESDAQRFRVA